MDWTPANSPDKAKEVWLRPQKFYPPEQPTGLEDLFQKATRLNDDTTIERTSRKAQIWKRWKQEFQNYKLHISMLLAGVAITLALGLGYMFLRRLFMSETSQNTYVQLDDL